MVTVRPLLIWIVPLEHSHLREFLLSIVHFTKKAKLITPAVRVLTAITKPTKN